MRGVRQANGRGRLSPPAIPSHLREQLGGHSSGRAWLDSLPRLLSECVDRWQLRVETAYRNGNASLVLPATRQDDSPVVLKIQFPHSECEHEAAALAHWDGDGAVRLLDHDEERHALLVERCIPGTHLSEIDPDSALGTMIDLLPRLWKPAGRTFRTLADEAAMWIEHLPEEWQTAGEPFKRSTLDTVLTMLDALSRSQGEQVLVHQDLHGDNVLRAQREPWLAIDPKPLVGEREFAVAPIVRSSELGHSQPAVRGRLARLTHELDLDLERARWWTITQTLAWAFDGALAHQVHLDVVGWLLEDT
jgi:streptomycin 6-kinase